MLLIIGIHAFAASACFEAERNALLDFKAGLTDPGSRLSSWEGQDCCKWRGVVCRNTTGHVRKLNLRNSYSNVDKRTSSLSGKISPSLLLLNHLERSDLSLNNFNGIRVPSYFGSLEKLRYLNLSRACFSGTVAPQLGNLSNLHYLDISSIGCGVYDVAVDNFAWLAHLSSLRYLDTSFVDMSIAADWFQAINKLPSLTYLDISDTNLPVIPTSLPYINITNLKVLKIAGNHINQTIPKWIWNLTDITYLDLSFNQFHGFIPEELSFLKSLKVLLRSNNFKGVSPKAFNNLCNSTTLDLSRVGFTGRGIRSVERLSSCRQQNLQILRFTYNKLRGNLSGWLECMTSLTDIDLSGNSLNGTIPMYVWKLPNLTSLYLESNFLEGVITEIELSYLKRMKWLSLSYNSLHVQVSQDWIPPFLLKGLKLASCHLGPKFPLWLQGQTQLEEINLSKTKIVDTLPDWLWNMSNSLEVIDLSYNQIKGKLPLSLDHVMLQYLNLRSNQFEGLLPALGQTLSILDLSDNFFTGPIPNSTLSSLQYLLLSNNSFDGNVPVSLCESASLAVLDISNNKLSGEIPSCLGMSQDQLVILDMMNNKLSGQIPIFLGKQNELSILNLRNNSMSGEIPSSLQYCAELIILDLGYNNFSGTIPEWIGQSLSVLMVLSLRSNAFFGSIPSEIVRLGNLRILDLSHNNLSGTIPRSIGNFSSIALEKGIPKDYIQSLEVESDEGLMGSLYFVVKGETRDYAKLLYLFESIDLSSNNLYGEISGEIGDLQALQNLNLSINHLTGHILDKIGKMHALESLDVAMNNLFGTIPQSLASLNYLSHLNLSYNNLSGKIPSGYQLQTLEDPSIYIGNPYLCRPPITQSCSASETNHVFGKKSHGRFERLGIYISAVLGFIIGFWIVCGVLLLSRSLRYAYFSAIDRTYDRLYVAVALTLIRLRRRCGEI